MNKSLFAKVLGFMFVMFLLLNQNENNILKTSKTVEAENVAHSPKTVIHFMSNLPNRYSGQGKIEQLIADKYMKEHPNVSIQFETLQDIAFQQKFKVYVLLNSVPDIYMTWTGPEFDLAQKVSAEINLKDFKGYGFNQGALQTRMKNGKLYGLPKDNNMYLIYYNKKIFDKYKIKIPTTFKELINASKELRKHGIMPCATNGKEKWELTGLYTDIYYRINPDPLKHVWNWDNAAFSKDPAALKAMNYYKQLMNAKFFQDGFAQADYGNARDLFTSGKAAMFYMGTWELSMESDKKLSEEFRKNLYAMTFPTIEGESTNISVVTKWYGGGYSIYKNSPVKKQALDFLKYFFKPENWAQLTWNSSACIPTQSVKSSNKESKLMKSVFNILIKTDKYKGNYPLSKKADLFVLPSRDLIYEFCIGILTPKQYLDRMDDGLKNAIYRESRK